MSDNIMYIPSIVLMVVEAGALIFLVVEWIRAFKEAKKRKALEDKQIEKTQP